MFSAGGAGIFPAVCVSSAARRDVFDGAATTNVQRDISDASDQPLPPPLIHPPVFSLTIDRISIFPGICGPAMAFTRRWKRMTAKIGRLSISVVWSWETHAAQHERSRWREQRLGVQVAGCWMSIER